MSDDQFLTIVVNRAHTRSVRRASGVRVVFACAILALGVTGCRARPDKAAKVQQEDMDALIEPSAKIREPIPPTAAMPSSPHASRLSSQEKIAMNKLIQRALKKANFYSGAIDGIVGPKTKKAIRDFQKSKGLAVDGIVGPKTWSELKKFL